MNISKFNISLSAAAMLLGGAMLTGCVAEESFGSADGEGVLKMRMVINSDITRAEMDDDTEAELRSGCVVYISDPAKGLLHKFKGLENLPDELHMKSGSYVAEAWTGDSVSASFDKKFFRGYQPFEITSGVNQVVINCKIANVVASVNSNTIDPSLVKDMKISVSNSKGSLDFTKDNYDFAKGYFMMPTGDTSLSYTVSGVNIEGKAFEKSGVIENVERAHEYVLNFSYNPEYEELGGSFITVTVDNTEIIVEDEVEILSRPSVSYVEGDIDRQVVGNAGSFRDDLIVKVAAFGGIKKLSLRSDKARVLGLPVGEGQEIDLMNLTSSAEEAVKASGIYHDIIFNQERNLASCLLVFPMDFLNKIPEAEEEYVIHLTAEDTYGKSTEKDIRLAIGEGAIVIEDPVLIDDISSLDMLAIGSHSVTLPISISSSDVVNPGIRYRVAGSSDAWTEVYLGAASSVVRRASRKAPAAASVRLTGLRPSTRYEIQAIADGFTSESRYITTEGVFTIPNASLEEWSKLSSNSKVLIPGAGGSVSFWDTGNHGSATMSKLITQSSSAMTHSGSFAAELKSQFVGIGTIGKMAAGNLFAGTYDKTDGTNGELTFGRQYDGSHPSSLKVWVNYRPGKAVKNKGADSSYIGEGQLDKGQIYVALSTEPVKIRTKDASKLFNPSDDCILAYGQYTFESNFGPDGALKELEIPLEYYEKARSTKPLYLIIVCSASKYGDFFSGGEGSLMYLDDFELVYE